MHKAQLGVVALWLSVILGWVLTKILNIGKFLTRSMWLVFPMLFSSLSQVTIYKSRACQFCNIILARVNLTLEYVQCTLETCHILVSLLS